jgi:hypothetical protein
MIWPVSWRSRVRPFLTYWRKSVSRRKRRIPAPWKSTKPNWCGNVFGPMPRPGRLPGHPAPPPTSKTKSRPRSTSRIFRVRATCCAPSRSRKKRPSTTFLIRQSNRRLRRWRSPRSPHPLLRPKRKLRPRPRLPGLRRRNLWRNHPRRDLLHPLPLLRSGRQWLWLFRPRRRWRRPRPLRHRQLRHLRGRLRRRLPWHLRQFLR